MLKEPPTLDDRIGDAGRPKRSPLKSSSARTTPERQSVTFANITNTQSSSSVRSNQPSVTYKSSIYPAELEIRGVSESEHPSREFDAIVKILIDKIQG
ncbi:hypothetical protein N7517_008784 [Penicillium concentricum]|uniref:Uncharacterized protein n=1 Tax=Penicillium concentricum TaxID=293559 RepID=A0A9W9RT15_9EURO|nr:uncharacterized protein N7517_008784 [Penicillium concentricum]KAJ5365898.1 hypothetical protein N7517_008784 [Penicillium concentricum]